MRRATTLRQALLASLLGLAFCVAATEAAQERFTYATLGFVSDGPIFIADERGYFRDQGIALEAVRHKDISEAIAMIASGQADGFGPAIVPSLINAIAKGIPVKAVADRGTLYPGYSYAALMVRKDLFDGGAIRKPSDLKGKRIALNAPLKGTAMAVLLHRLLLSAGLSESDIDLAVVPYPQMVQALANKSVDVAALNEPFVSLAIKQNVGVPLLRFGDFRPGTNLAVLVFGPSITERNPELGRRFMVAYLKGVRDYNAAFGPERRDRAAVVEIMAKRTALKDRAAYEDVQFPKIDPNGKIPRASVEEDVQQYFDWKMIAQKPNLSTLIDERFIEAAVQRLGSGK